MAQETIVTIRTMPSLASAGTVAAPHASDRVARQCYRLLRAELGRRLLESRRWHGVPSLLDELDALRRLQCGDPAPRLDDHRALDLTQA